MARYGGVFDQECAPGGYRSRSYGDQSGVVEAHGACRTVSEVRLEFVSPPLPVLLRNDLLLPIGSGSVETRTEPDRVVVVYRLSFLRLLFVATIFGGYLGWVRPDRPIFDSWWLKGVFAFGLIFSLSYVIPVLRFRSLVVQSMGDHSVDRDISPQLLNTTPDDTR